MLFLPVPILMSKFTNFDPKLLAKETTHRTIMGGENPV